MTCNLLINIASRDKNNSANNYHQHLYKSGRHHDDDSSSYHYDEFMNINATSKSARICWSYPYKIYVKTLFDLSKQSPKPKKVKQRKNKKYKILYVSNSLMKL